jgi:hypothetical protein
MEFAQTMQAPYPPRPTAPSRLLWLLAGGAALVLLGGLGAVGVMLALRQEPKRAPEPGGSPEQALRTSAMTPLEPGGRAPGPAPNAWGCAVDTGAVTAGQRTRVDALTLTVREGRVGLGWVSHASARHGHDDAAAVLLDDHGRLIATLDPETDDRVGGIADDWARVSLGRVTVTFPGGAAQVATDGRSPTPTGVDLACGALHAPLMVRAPTFDGLLLPQSPPSGVYDCQTLHPDAPFALAVRAESADGLEPTDRVSVLVVRGASGEGVSAAWTLPLGRVRPPADGLWRRRFRELASIDGVQSLALPSGEHLVGFRYRRRLQLGWLGADLRARGPLVEVPTLGGEVGLPRLAWNGHEALVTFADRGPTPPRERGAPTPEPPPYSVYALRIAPGATLQGLAPQRLDTRETVDGEEFAPSPAALVDGSWLLAWTDGNKHTHDRDEASQQGVWLRRYSRVLVPVGDAVDITPTESASDPRLAVVGERFVVALASGRGRGRVPLVRSGSCQALP